MSGFYAIKSEAFFILRQDDKAIKFARRSLAPYDLILILALALGGQQAQASEALKAYLADSRPKSKTITQFQTQQLSMASNPGWITYNERFAERLRKRDFQNERPSQDSHP